MYPPDTFMTQNPTHSSATHWSRHDDKAFEQALVRFPQELPDRWVEIAKEVGKTVREVEEHYQALEHDVYEIDSGRVELPNYVEECYGSGWDGPAAQISFGGGKSKHGGGDGDRKKGTPWTEEEHKKFLWGLNKYGKGDWRSISRNVVITRTPTQVASHAQKYFLRQNSAVKKKERKRSSIHDITTVDSNGGLPVDQCWVPQPGETEHSVDQSWVPQPGEPVQQLQTMQALPNSGHFASQEGLIPSSHMHNQGHGGSFGYPNFSFPM